MFRRRVPLLILILTASMATVSRAQEPEPDTTIAAEAGADDAAVGTEPLVVDTGPSPSGAFIRSLVLPGWGEVASSAPIRGAVFFAGHAANVGMTVKTLRKLGDVRDIEAGRRAMVEDSILEAAENDPELADSIASNPFFLEDQVEGHPEVADLVELRESREGQREDWLVFGVFWMLASAVDAYVAAQLADFPGDISAARSAGGGMRLQISVPFGRR